MSKISKEQILSVARSLMAGGKCFISRKSGKIHTFPADESLMDMLVVTEAEKMRKKLKSILRKEAEYYSISPVSGYYLFSIMEDFTRNLKDMELKLRLRKALSLHKPIPLFKEIIEESLYYQDWLQYQEKRYTDWVEKQLRLQTFPDAEDIAASLG